MYKVAMTTGKNANVFSVLGPAFGLALHLDHLYSRVNLVKEIFKIFFFVMKQSFFFFFLFKCCANMLIFLKNSNRRKKKG